MVEPSFLSVSVRDPSTGSDFAAKGSSFAGWGDPGDSVVITGAWEDDPR